jgi:hypothetical protein
VTLLDDAKTLARQLRSTIDGMNRLSMARYNCNSKGIDAVYEVYIDLVALKELRARWTLRMENSSRGRWLDLPLNPANKANYPYFVASKEGADRFQICFGTKIEMSTGTTFAPDMSIQKPSAPVKPREDDIAFCWDQKYTESDKVDRDHLFNFAGKIKLLKPRATLPVEPFKLGSVWPNTNAIVTNATASTLTPEDLQKLDVVEISNASPCGSPIRRP